MFRDVEGNAGTIGTAGIPGSFSPGSILDLGGVADPRGRGNLANRAPGSSAS